VAVVIDIDHARGHRAAGQGGEPCRGVVGHGTGDVWIDAALEPAHRLAVHAQRFGRAAHVHRVEVGHFQKDVGGAVLHFGLRAAHHAGQGHAAVAIGDQQVLAVHRTIDAVQGGQLLALSRPTDDDFAAAQLVVVEGVDRVAPLQHDEVGDVDDVVDRPYAG